MKALMSRASTFLSQAFEKRRKSGSPVPAPLPMSNRQLFDLNNKVTMSPHVCLPEFGGGSGEIWMGVMNDSDGQNFDVSVSSHLPSRQKQ